MISINIIYKIINSVLRLLSITNYIYKLTWLLIKKNHNFLYELLPYTL